MALVFLTWLCSMFVCGITMRPITWDDMDGLIVQWKGPFGSDKEKHKGHVAELSQRSQVALALADINGYGQSVVKVNANGKTNEDAIQVMAKLAAQSMVDYVEPNLYFKGTIALNDPDYADQWNLQAPHEDPYTYQMIYGMNLPPLWDTTNGSSVVVAVLDTGILYDHPDLQGNALPGVDMVSDPSKSNDGDGRDMDASDPGDYIYGSGQLSSTSSWHGSQTAGIAAAVGQNQQGIVGVAWGAKLLPVRVLGAGTQGTLADIINGILWAADNYTVIADITNRPTQMAKVMSMSFSAGGTCPSTLQKAINDAAAKGIVFTAAAGNSAIIATNSIPCNCVNVICVGAHGASGTQASYSNYGPLVAVYAPGGDADVGILTTANGGLTTPLPSYSDSLMYSSFAGTSAACPHVAGLAALMLSIQDLTPQQIKTILVETSFTTPAGINIVDGYGVLKRLVDPSPSPSPASPPTPSSSRSPRASRSPSPSRSPIRSPSPSPRPPTNDFCGQALPLTCNSTVRGTTRLATYQSTPYCTVQHTSPDVWYYFEAHVAMTVALSLCNSANFDTKLTLYSGRCEGLTCVLGADDSPGCALTSVVRTTIQSGHYYAMVHGYSSKVGDFNLAFTCIYSAPDVALNVPRTMTPTPTATASSTLTTVPAVAPRPRTATSTPTASLRQTQSPSQSATTTSTPSSTSTSSTSATCTAVPSPSSSPTPTPTVPPVPPIGTRTPIATASPVFNITCTMTPTPTATPISATLTAVPGNLAGNASKGSLVDTGPGGQGSASVTPFRWWPWIMSGALAIIIGLLISCTVRYYRKARNWEMLSVAIPDESQLPNLAVTPDRSDLHMPPTSKPEIPTHVSPVLHSTPFGYFSPLSESNSC